MTAASGLEGLRFSIISLITSKGACFGGRSSRVLFCALASPSWGIALGLVRPGPTLPASPAASRAACCDGHPTMDPLHATIEELAADGYTHIQCYCPRCRAIRLRPISYLPRISLGLTIAQLSTRLRAKRGGQLHSVMPWRLEDVLGKPLGRRG